MAFILATSGKHLGTVDIEGTIDAETISVALGMNVLNAMVVQGPSGALHTLDGYTPPAGADEIQVVLGDIALENRWRHTNNGTQRWYK